MKTKIMWNKFKIRLTACYRILFRKYDHWVIIDVDDKNLRLLLQEKDFQADLLYHGVRSYIFHTMIKKVANSKNDIDMILEKAKFEGKCELNK